MKSAETAARRERELDRYDALRSAPGRELQALVDLAAQVFEVPSAAINLITGTEQHQVATAGFEPSVCVREDSMCAAVVNEPDPVVVSDASLDERFADNPFVTGRIGAVRFYASAPLVTPAGVPLGRLCVFDERPRQASPEQTKALRTLADRVMDVLELRFRSRQLESSLGEITEMRDELRRSNQNLTLFAGQISHDLRSPLMAISANAEVLSTEAAVASDPSLLGMVDSITGAARRMSALIEDILAFAREGGQLRVEATPLDKVVDLVLADLAPRVEETGAEITVGPLPTVPGDPDMLYSVCLNLLTNALKFTRPGVTPVVRVDAERVEDRWRTSVTDNGVGLPADLHEEVFELFARAGPGPDGSGIGLATVKRVVEAHGGRVGIQPDAGQDAGPGLTVWFELPG